MHVDFLKMMWGQIRILCKFRLLNVSSPINCDGDQRGAEKAVQRVQRGVHGRYMEECMEECAGRLQRVALATTQLVDDDREFEI